MIRKAALGAIASIAFSSFAQSQIPNVAVDIAPLHSLVSQVMGNVGEPALLIRPEASPHGYTLRPSEARALSNADVVFWIGEGLTPWLGKSLNSLAGSAKQIEMSEVAGLTTYDFREGATFEAHDHEHEESDHDEHHEEHEHEHEDSDHDEHHEEHAHEHEHDDHDDHSATEEHHEHHHEGHDPHLWLDPVNAQVWVKEIAKVLSDVDPENAAAYAKNAEAALTNLVSLQKNLQQQAEDLHGIKFIVFHDAYQYFEKRFDVIASGAISISDASDPSPARIQDIRNTVANLGVTCVFTEPQFNPNLVKTVFERSTVKTIGTMDPLGATIAPGKSQYTNLLTDLIQSLQQCQG